MGVRFWFYRASFRTLMTRRHTSRSRGSILVAFLAVLFSLGLIALFAAYGTLRELITPQWVREHIVPRIENALGREITFEGLSMGLGEVILTGVRLSENPEFATDDEAYFAVVERLQLGLDVWALSELRLVVDRLELVRPYVRLRRLEDARWNISALVGDAKARSKAIAADKAAAAPTATPAEPAPWGRALLIETLRSSLLDWTAWLIHDVHINGGLLLVEDDAALFEKYKRVAVRGISLKAQDFRLDSPIDFHVNAEIVPDPERFWIMDADATFDLTENQLRVTGIFDHFEPDLLISQLARPLNLPPKPKKPEPAKPFRLDADLKVARLPFWRFDAGAVTGSISFRRRTLELRNIKARQGGGALAVNGSIVFEPTYAQYDLGLRLDKAPFSGGVGMLLPPPWNDVLGTQSLEVRGKFKDPRGHPFGQSLLGIGVEDDPNAYLRATVVIDSPILDLDALTHRAATTVAPEARDYGPIDTGRLDAEIAVTLDRLRFRNIDFLDARAKASIRNSTVEIAALESGIEGGGTANLSGNVILNRPGFAYAARLDIDSADHGVLLRSVARPNWGERSGRTDVRLSMSGTGTRWKTLSPNLRADLAVVVHDGHIYNAEYLDLLAEESGIDGFRNMELLESGGRITVEDGRVRTKKLTLGSDDARILMKGSLGFDETLDLKVKLGFGPDSQRRILSKGVLLPYQHDDDGWTNIPLLVTGTFEKPDIAIETSALASTAVNVVPDATKRIGKESANVTRAITDKAADAMPKPAGDLLRGAHSATERVIGGTYGSLEKLVRGLGRVLTGRANGDSKERDKDGTDEKNDERPSKAIEELSGNVESGSAPAPKPKPPVIAVPPAAPKAPELKAPRDYERNELPEPP